MGKVLGIAAVVLFAAGFILVAFTDGNGKLITDALWLGLTAFAAAHVID